jgi:ELWxxDGT repeat protein
VFRPCTTLRREDVIDVDGTVFFLGRHSTRGTGLWRTDGTVQGTTLIKAMTPGHLGRAGKTLFFSSGKELWKSDGTPQGTTLVRDLTASIDTEPFDLRDVGGTLFFLVNMVSTSGDWDGQELWKSDGTADGTVLLKALNPGFQAAVTPLYPTSVNGTLFLRAQNGVMPGGITPHALWKSDGTPESTVLLKEVNPGSLSYLYSYPNTLVNVDGTLFFAADEPPWDGPIAMDLWKSDGTPEGTVKVKVLGPPQVTNPTDFTNVNGRCSSSYTASTGATSNESGRRHRRARPREDDAQQPFWNTRLHDTRQRLRVLQVEEGGGGEPVEERRDAGGHARVRAPSGRRTGARQRHGVLLQVRRRAVEDGRDPRGNGLREGRPAGRAGLHRESDGQRRVPSVHGHRRRVTRQDTGAVGDRRRRTSWPTTSCPRRDTGGGPRDFLPTGT